MQRRNRNHECFTMAATMSNSAASPSRPWCVYLLECASGAYYAGVTNDLDARFRAHQAGRGAKYTRANRPLRILASRGCDTRAEAQRMEYAVKRLPRDRKLRFFEDPAWVPHPI